MTTALKIFAVLSSGLAIFVTSWSLYETSTIPLFLLLFCCLTCLYVAHLLEWLTLPRSVRNAAYFSSVSVHVLATLFGLFALCIALFYIVSDLRQGVPLSGSPPVPVAFISYGLIAPAGLFTILWLNRHNLLLRRASLLLGALIALPLAALLFAPEYLWIKYHEQRLSTAQAEDVISSVHSLSNFPISQRIMGHVVCKNLLIRDIDDEYFMYNNDQTFLEDRGVGKIEAALHNRFGDKAGKVVDEVKTTFGSDIMLNCSRWTNPTSG